MVLSHNTHHATLPKVHQSVLDGSQIQILQSKQNAPLFIAKDQLISPDVIK